MAHPPPPPPPGGYGAPPPGGYGAPPPGGYGGPPPGGYGPGAPSPGFGSGAGGPIGGAPGSSNRALILLMSALVVVVLLVVAGLLVLRAQGGDDDVELTEAQLEDALLTAADVGDGFTEEADDGDEDDDEQFDRDQVDGSEECLDLYEELAASDTEGSDAPEADRTFSRDDESEVEVGLSGPTAVSIDDVRSIISTCDEITVDDGDNVGTLRFSGLDDLPDVGDERAGIRMEVDLDAPFDVTLESATVLWTRDGIQAQASVTGPLDPATFEGGPADLDLIARVARAQDERLAQAIDDAR